MKSPASTLDEYLSGLPEERRRVVETVRAMIKKHLPKGYREAFNWGMLSYEIPLEKYPDTYNGQPLAYVALAAQKNYYAIYLMGVYGDPEKEKSLRDAFRKAGKKMDIGKSCLRFKTLEDLPLDAVGKVIASISVAQYIEKYEKARKR